MGDLLGLHPFSAFSRKPVCPREMFSGRLEKHQVFYAVIVFFVVYVMDNLALIQNSPYMFFHHQSMLCVIALSCGAGVVWRMKESVSFPHNYWLNLRLAAALITTKKPGAISTLWQKFFSANLANALMEPVGSLSYPLSSTSKSARFDVLRRIGFEALPANGAIFV